MLDLVKCFCVTLGGLIAVATSPANSMTPPLIYPHDYFGPYTACRPGIAVPVNVGEKLTRMGSTDTLYFSGGQLWTDIFVQDPVRDADIVHFRGNVEVPGLGSVIRYELTSRNSNYRGIGYVYDTGKPYFMGHYQVLFRSDQFTGADTDTKLLARIVGGAKADMMCAGPK